MSAESRKQLAQRAKFTDKLLYETPPPKDCTSTSAIKQMMICVLNNQVIIMKALAE